MQLQSSNEQLKATNKLHEGLGRLMHNITGSLDDTQKYKEEVAQLASNLSALNTIYGNMLTAMSFNHKKVTV